MRSGAPRRRSLGGDTTLRVVDAAEFERLLPRFADRDHQLSTPYLEAISRLHHERVERIAIEQHGEVISLAAVRLRRLPLVGGVALAAGGPVVGMGDVAGAAGRYRVALDALAREYTRRGIRLHVRPPVLPTIEGWDEVEPALAPSPLFGEYRTMVIDLADTYDQRRAALTSHWRKHLHAAEQADMELAETDIADAWRRLRPLYEELHLRKHFDVTLPPEFWDDVFAHELAEQWFQGFLVRHHDADVAGMIIGGGGGGGGGAVATCLLSASTPAALELFAGYLSMWATIGIAARLGYRYLDLGGYDRERNPGGWQFKHGLGGRDVCAPHPLLAAPSGVRGGVVALAERAAERMRRRA